MTQDSGVSRAEAERHWDVAVGTFPWNTFGSATTPTTRSDTERIMDAEKLRAAIKDLLAAGDALRRSAGPATAYPDLWEAGQSKDVPHIWVAMEMGDKAAEREVIRWGMAGSEAEVRAVVAALNGLRAGPATASPEDVGPYRQALDALVGASEMTLSEALAGAFLLLDAPLQSPHITLPRDALITILRAVRAAVVLQERAVPDTAAPTEEKG